MLKLKWDYVKKKIKLATHATKKLIEAGFKGSDEFPKLFAEYKWSGTLDYNMALIILAFINYCRIKKIKILSEISILDGLVDGDGSRICDLLERNKFAIEKVLESVLPKTETHEYKVKRDKVIKSFIKQADKITKWRNKTNSENIEDFCHIYKCGVSRNDYDDQLGPHDKYLGLLDDNIIKSKNINKIKNFFNEKDTYKLDDPMSSLIIPDIINRGCSKEFMVAYLNFLLEKNVLIGYFGNTLMLTKYLGCAVEKNRTDIAKVFLDKMMANGVGVLPEHIELALKHNNLELVKRMIDLIIQKKDTALLEKKLSDLFKYPKLEKYILGKYSKTKIGKTSARNAIQMYLKGSDKPNLTNEVLGNANLGEFFDGKSDKK